MAVWNVINHTELSSANATLIDWTSIPASYDHLCVILSPRGDNSGTIVSYKVQLNGETSATNYSYINFYYQGSSVQNEQYTNQATISAYPRMPAAAAGADCFGTLQMWIPNYAYTSGGKQVLTMNSAQNTSTSTNAFYMYYVAGNWNNTAAINQITITASSDDFVQYSSATLYGINGAA
tara:strand:- start:402 stop:938 length:537 start_codon:yes stop_codon:yes gene_type:complete